MILAGDVGGTHCRLAVFSRRGRTSRLEGLEVFASRDYGGLIEVIDAFTRAHPDKIEAACIGVAGPVRENRVHASNLPWVVSSVEVASRLGLRRVELINDLEATAHGLEALGPDDLLVLNSGAPQALGNIALVAAGTGLGEGALVWNGREHSAFASEGGHVDFAPRNELEIELLRFLERDYGRVSYERVISGAGLFNIYRFLRDTGRGKEEDWLARRLAGEDPPAVVSAAGLDGSSELCAQALDLFVSIYGAEAGNAALKFLAAGGVYIAGGIAPKILRKLQEPAFMRSFLDKGRMSAFLEAVPVRVVLNERVGLIGAARRAFLSIVTKRPRG